MMLHCPEKMSPSPPKKRARKSTPPTKSKVLSRAKGTFGRVVVRRLTQAGSGPERHGTDAERDRGTSGALCFGTRASGRTPRLWIRGSA